MKPIEPAKAELFVESGQMCIRDRHQDRSAFAKLDPCAIVQLELPTLAEHRAIDERSILVQSDQEHSIGCLLYTSRCV